MEYLEVLIGNPYCHWYQPEDKRFKEMETQGLGGGGGAGEQEQ